MHQYVAVHALHAHACFAAASWIMLHSAKLVYTMDQPCCPCEHPEAVNTAVQRARSGQPTRIGWAPLNSRSRTAGRRGWCSRQNLRSSPPTPPGPAQQADRLSRRCTLQSPQTMQTGPQATDDERVCFRLHSCAKQCISARPGSPHMKHSVQTGLAAMLACPGKAGPT